MSAFVYMWLMVMPWLQSVSKVPGVAQRTVVEIVGGSGVQGDVLIDDCLPDIADRRDGVLGGGSLTKDSGLVEHPGCQHAGKGQG